MNLIIEMFVVVYVFFQSDFYNFVRNFRGHKPGEFFFFLLMDSTERSRARGAQREPYCKDVPERRVLLSSSKGS